MQVSPSIGMAPMLSAVNLRRHPQTKEMFGILRSGLAVRTARRERLP
jgi:hypothetical protein